MAKSARDLADRQLDGTYPPELRRIGRLAELAWELQTETDMAHYAAYATSLTPEPYHPQLRQIAADAYALWRLIETTCAPIVEAWEREQDDELVATPEQWEEAKALAIAKQEDYEREEQWRAEQDMREFDEAHLGGI